MSISLFGGQGVSLLRARHTPHAVRGWGSAACTPERRARHTPHATRSTVENCGTCARSASIAYITSDLYVSLFLLSPLSSELALQAGARPIGEKWPVSVQAYDCTFRQQDAHIWLSTRLQSILVRLFGDQPLLIHKYGVAVARSLVERQCTHNSLQKAFRRLSCCTWLALLGCRDTHNSLQKMPGRLRCSTWLVTFGCSIRKTFPSKKVQVQAVFEGRRTARACTHTQYSAKKRLGASIHTISKQEGSVRDRIGFVSPARSVLTHKLVKIERVYGLRGAASEPHPSKYFLALFCGSWLYCFVRSSFALEGGVYV